MFRKIFRAPSTTINKNENIHTTNTSDSTTDDMSDVKQGASHVTNHLYTGKRKRIVLIYR
jgi:hypothetical protein